MQINCIFSVFVGNQQDQGMMLKLVKNENRSSYVLHLIRRENRLQTSKTDYRLIPLAHHAKNCRIFQVLPFCDSANEVKCNRFILLTQRSVSLPVTGKDVKDAVKPNLIFR